MIPLDSFPQHPLSFDRGCWGKLSKEKGVADNHLAIRDFFEFGGLLPGGLTAFAVSPPGGLSVVYSLILILWQHKVDDTTMDMDGRLLL